MAARGAALLASTARCRCEVRTSWTLEIRTPCGSARHASAADADAATGPSPFWLALAAFSRSSSLLAASGCSRIHATARGKRAAGRTRT